MARSKGVTIALAIDALSVVDLLHFEHALAQFKRDLQQKGDTPLAVTVDELQAVIRRELLNLFAGPLVVRKKRVQKFQPTPLALAPLVEVPNGK